MLPLYATITKNVRDIIVQLQAAQQTVNVPTIGRYATKEIVMIIVDLKNVPVANLENVFTNPTQKDHAPMRKDQSLEELVKIQIITVMDFIARMIAKGNPAYLAKNAKMVNASLNDLFPQFKIIYNQTLYILNY